MRGQTLASHTGEIHPIIIIIFEDSRWLSHTGGVCPPSAACCAAVGRQAGGARRRRDRRDGGRDDDAAARRLPAAADVVVLHAGRAVDLRPVDAALADAAGVGAEDVGEAPGGGGDAPAGRDGRAGGVRGGRGQREEGDGGGGDDGGRWGMWGVASSVCGVPQGNVLGLDLSLVLGFRWYINSRSISCIRYGIQQGD